MEIEAPRQKSEIKVPQRRTHLHARIIEAGYHNLTAFAKELGLSKGYLSAVISGHTLPTLERQFEFAETLGLSLPELQRLL